MAAAPSVVLGVIGADCHAVGNRILDLALRGAGFNPVNLGVMVSQDEFVAAAKKSGAVAILVSSLYGHAELDCRGLRAKCDAAGLGGILLYLGGNLAVGKTDFGTVEAKFLAMGFDRVFPQGTTPEEGIAALQEDLARRGSAGG